MHRSLTRPIKIASVVLALAVATVPAEASAQQQDRNAPGAPHESNIVVGEVPPTTFSLDSIDGDTYDLASVDRPILLLFFRGTW
ncbi:MAG: hypothetical protein GKS06_11620 [Acidobacteria bacterium]|nr:hypothetical protein [Acidobacteriota bacterium]